MAAETSTFIDFLEHQQDDLGVEDDDGDHQQRGREATGRGRDFSTLFPLLLEESEDFEDFYHSDSEQSVDLESLHLRFAVDYDEIDGEDFLEEAGMVPSVAAVDGDSDADSVREGGVFRRENRVNFVRDLFQDRVEQHQRSELVTEGLSASDSGVVDDSNYLDLGLGLGLGLDFGDEENSDFRMGEVEGDFFLGNRRMEGAEFEADGSDFSSEEEDYELDYGNPVDDVSMSLCLDSLPLEDQREADEELEWEEVGDGGIEELERDVSAMALDGEEDIAFESVLQLRNEEVARERVVMGWEVLLNAGGGMWELGNEDPYFGPEGFTYADDYETFFGQFAETGATVNPPAAKYVVDNLAIVDVTQVDVESNNALCAICRDEMGVGEKAKRLPCSHRFHGDCIVPWLSIRNTCPVCRSELPTEDAAYERRRTQMTRRAQ